MEVPLIRKLAFLLFDVGKELRLHCTFDTYIAANSIFSKVIPQSSDEYLRVKIHDKDIEYLYFINKEERVLEILKVLKKLILNSMNSIFQLSELLAGLIDSDGHIDLNGTTISIHVKRKYEKNFMDFLCKLNLFKKGKHSMYYFNREEYAYLLPFVVPAHLRRREMFWKKLKMKTVRYCDLPQLRIRGRITVYFDPLLYIRRGCFELHYYTDERDHLIDILPFKQLSRYRYRIYISKRKIHYLYFLRELLRYHNILYKGPPLNEMIKNLSYLSKLRGKILRRIFP